MSLNKECLICKSGGLKKLAGYYDRHQLIKCSDCGFVFMEKIPTKEELIGFYSRYSYGSDGYLSPITIKSYNLLLDEFEGYRKSNRLLDVGCGRGWFLQEAKKRGWEVYGSEYSTKAIELCENGGIQMISGKLNAGSFESENFDVITSFEVLEHINNPKEEVSNIHKFLRKGGLFYSTTPNFNSLMRYYLKANYNVIGYPEHLSYYTKRTLHNLLSEEGFHRTKFLCTGISISRIKTSKRTSYEQLISKESSDEKLREQIEQKWVLGVAKRLANWLMTKLSLGMTLKGYYIKM